MNGLLLLSSSRRKHKGRSEARNLFMPLIVTLDGPAGAGKSSAARALAARLNVHYMDTGAMYRALAWAAMQRGYALENSALIAELAREVQIVFDTGRVLVDGTDVSAEIRSEKVTAATRYVADAPAVREVMKIIQRKIGSECDIVTEGRDQGTVVFPTATVKVFLTASAVHRAKRRHQEEVVRGSGLTFQEVLESQSVRDAADIARPVGALVAAVDAVVIETDSLTLDEVVECLVSLVEETRQARGKHDD